MTSTCTMNRAASREAGDKRRSLRRERLERIAHGVGTPAADPVFAAAARESLSPDSGTFLKDARQTRGE
jgi:hypothetical protein